MITRHKPLQVHLFDTFFQLSRDEVIKKRILPLCIICAVVSSFDTFEAYVRLTLSFDYLLCPLDQPYKTFMDMQHRVLLL